MKPWYMPEVQLLLWAVALLILEACRPRTGAKIMGRLASLGVVLVLAGTFCPYMSGPAEIHFEWSNLYYVDPLAVFFKRFFLVTLIVVLRMGEEFVDELPLGRAEFLILPLFPAIGMMLLASAYDFMTVFAALELVTISFYILVAMQRNRAAALEAGVKYLVMGALSTGFLVYGIAFLFGSAGGTSFTQVTQSLASQPLSLGMLLALVLIVVGLGFKISAVPFHAWAPDVYQGAPTPVTAFLAVGSKAAGFAVLLRILCFDALRHDSLVPYIGSLLGLLAAMTVVLGNFAALPQRNLKRLLAYSSIGHAGFILMALSCQSVRGVDAVLIYLILYMLAALLAFFVITVVSRQVGGEELPHYTGLARRSPLAAFGLMIALISMAGIPPLAGFVGKLAVFAAVWEGKKYLLLVLGILSAAAGLYYYLGVVRAMYWNEPAQDGVKVKLSCSASLLIWILALSLIVLGFYQMPLGAVVRRVMGDF